MDETVYLLHLEPGLPVTGNRIARHYIGWTHADVDARVGLHQRGHGSPFIAAAVAAGAQISLLRTWPGIRSSLRAAPQAPPRGAAPVPRCVTAGVTGGRGP